jgi:hypothetical protein
VQAYSTDVTLGNVTQWSFNPPSATTPYYFAVRARNSAGQISPYSTEVLLEPRGVVPAPPGTGDLNNDGRIDLIWQHESNGLLSAWFMNGTSLAGSSALTPNQVTDTNWKIVGSADFNHDGELDLFWQHQVTRLMTIWFMNGTSFVGPGLLSNNTVSDTNWEIRAIGDFTGDGSPDLIWQHRVSGSLVAWVLNGMTLVTGRPLNPTSVSDTAWKIVGSGDFNGDNLLDLVWQNQTSGLVTIWLMNGTNFVAGRSLYPTGAVSDPAWKVATVADVNADGRPDLVWQHRTAGYASAWLMNGTSVMRTTLLQPGQLSDLNWRIIGPR